jgi:hypothetical protein
MAEQGQQPQGESQAAELFKNVGQGLLLIGQYVQQAAPEGVELVGQLIQGYDQLIQMVGAARQQEGGQPQQQAQQPVPQEAGAANVQQAL